MTVLFVGMTVFGLVETTALLALATVFRQSDRGGPSFHLMGQAVGFVAVGVGGLAMTWANIGTFGLSIVALVVWGVLIAFVYKVALPYTEQRWPTPPAEPSSDNRSHQA